MATIKLDYIASSTVTCTLASLASDTNLLAGRESASVDNSTNEYADYLLAGRITTGTSPTDARQIEVHVVGQLDDTTWPDVFDGTDSNETITSVGIKATICRPAAVIATNNTSDRTYPFGPVSVASLFGGVCPRRFVVFVVHNTGVNLNSTGSNHEIDITPIQWQSV